MDSAKLGKLSARKMVQPSPDKMHLCYIISQECTISELCVGKHVKSTGKVQTETLLSCFWALIEVLS